jgi:hypothetical protein
MYNDDFSDEDPALCGRSLWSRDNTKEQNLDKDDNEKVKSATVNN